MTLIQFQVFIAVIEAGSFTRAADALHMTQSAVSQTIHALEAELGVTLLVRNRSGVYPTHIGGRIQQHAREILTQVRCMTDEATAAKGVEEGTLRIGSTPSISARFLPGLLGEFKKRFPGVNIALFEGNQSDMNQWLLNSVIDVGLLELPASESIETVPLLSDSLSVVVSHDHAFASRNTVSLEEIANECLILSKAEANALVGQLFHERGLYVNSKFEVQDMTTILALVLEGIGIGLLPELSIPKHLEALAKVPLAPAIIQEVGIGVRALATISPVAAEFVLHTQNYAMRFITP